MKDYFGLIQCDFKADAPNQKWTTDITEISLFGTKQYLSPILDMCNSEIISYNISEHPVLNQILDMLDKVFFKIPDDINFIFHSDQGVISAQAVSKTIAEKRDSSKHVAEGKLSG